MNEQEKERLMKQLVENDYFAVEVPDLKESWNRVYARLEKRRRIKRWMNRLKVTAAIVMLVIVINMAMTVDKQ